MQDYNNEVERITTLTNNYNAKVTEYNAALSTYNNLIDTYNNDYANRALSSAAYQKSIALKSELDAQRLTVTRLRGELDQLTLPQLRAGAHNPKAPGGLLALLVESGG